MPKMTPPPPSPEVTTTTTKERDASNDESNDNGTPVQAMKTKMATKAFKTPSLHEENDSHDNCNTDEIDDELSRSLVNFETTGTSHSTMKSECSESKTSKRINDHDMETCNGGDGGDDDSIMADEEYIHDPHYTQCFNYDDENSTMMLTQQQDEYCDHDHDDDENFHYGGDCTTAKRNGFQNNELLITQLSNHDDYSEEENGDEDDKSLDRDCDEKDISNHKNSQHRGLDLDRKRVIQQDVKKIEGKGCSSSTKSRTYAKKSILEQLLRNSDDYKSNSVGHQNSSEQSEEMKFFEEDIDGKSNQHFNFNHLHIHHCINHGNNAVDGKKENDVSKLEEIQKMQNLNYKNDDTKLDFVHLDSSSCFTEDSFNNDDIIDDNKNDDGGNNKDVEKNMETNCNHDQEKQEEQDFEIVEVYPNCTNKPRIDPNPKQKCARIMNEIKHGYEAILSNIRNNDDLTAGFFTEDSQEIRKKDGIKEKDDNDNTNTDLVVDAKEDKIKGTFRKQKQQQPYLENNVTDNVDYHEVSKLSVREEAQEIRTIENEDGVDNNLDLDDQERSDTDDERDYDIINDVNLLFKPSKNSSDTKPPEKNASLSPQLTSNSQSDFKNIKDVKEMMNSAHNDITSSTKQLEENEEKRNENPIKEISNTLQRNEINGNENNATSRTGKDYKSSINEHPSPAINVYSGITQSLPSQLIFTHPDNSNNSNTTAISTSSHKDYHRHSNKADDSVGSKVSHHHLTSTMDQYHLNLDSAYDASTEVIKSPSFSNSQESGSIQCGNDDENVDALDICENKYTDKRMESNRIGNKIQSLAMLDDSYNNDATFPLNTPTKSTQNCSVSSFMDSKLTKPTSGEKQTGNRSSRKEIEEQSLLNNSEETKTVIVNLSSIPKDIATINDCRNTLGGLDSKSQSSILGPTPPQPDVSLSYPNDYRHEYESNHKESITDMNIQARSEQFGLHANVSLFKEESSCQSSLDESKKEILEPSVAKEVIDKSNNNGQNNNIVDSNEENQLKYCNGKATNSFLPPLLGSLKKDADIGNKNLKKSRQVINGGGDGKFSGEAKTIDSKKYPGGDKQVECDIDEIIEGFSQIIPDKIRKKNERIVLCKSGGKGLKSKSIETNPVTSAMDAELMMSSLTDTQPEMEHFVHYKPKLGRIKRGCSDCCGEKMPKYSQTASREYVGCSQNYDDGESMKGRRFEKIQFNGGYGENDAGVNEQNLHSRTDNDIKAMLQNLGEINVNELKDRLLKSPIISMESAHKQIYVFRAENRKLQKSNKYILEENEQLKHKLSILSARLKEKTYLCNEMKSKLDQFQTLIQIVQHLGGSSEETAKYSKGIQNGKKILQKTISNSPIQKEKNDIMVGDDEAPKKRLFQTPKAQQRVPCGKKSAVVSVSTKKRSRGNITFKMLWRSLQNAGWKYKRGPEPFGNVYVPPPPHGSVKTGSVLGKDFFHADHQLWTKAEQLGIIDVESSHSECSEGKYHFSDDYSLSSTSDLDKINLRSIARKESLSLGETHLQSTGKKKRRMRKRNIIETSPYAVKISSKAKRPKGQTDESGKDTLVSMRCSSTPISPSKPSKKETETLSQLTESIGDFHNAFLKQDNSCGSIVTKLGVRNFLDFKTKINDFQQKRARPNDSSKRREKGSPQNIACHLTQASDNLRLGSLITPIPNKIPKCFDLPLKGFTFFGSGIDNDVVKRVINLGGKYLKDIQGESLKRSNIIKKVFFLSDITSRRTHKYLLACALGVPMLHFQWLHAIERKLDAYHLKLSSGESNYFPQPSIFDADLYKSFRLPLGLSTESYLFVLQRASHAKKWRGLITDSGSYIFTGLNILVVLGDLEAEKKWMTILQLAGATVFNSADVDKGSMKIDIVLTDSLHLPPQVTAVTPKIAKVVNKFAFKNTTHILDLSWATQCIVRKRRIQISENFKVKLDNRSFSRFVNVSSIKVAQHGNLTRYEVGDSIQFGKNKSILSYGRITDIRVDTRSRNTMIEINILELHSDCELMDGGQNVSTITIGENELRGHILILGGKDFKEVHWSDNQHVFMQKKAPK